MSLVDRKHPCSCAYGFECGRCAGLRMDNERLRAQVADLTRDREEMRRDFAETLVKTQRERNRWRDQAADMENERNDWRKEAQERPVILRAQVVQLTESLTAERQQVADLTRERDEWRTAHGRVAGAMEQAIHERDAARAWRREAESVQRQLMSEKVGIRAELKDAKQQVADLQGRLKLVGEALQSVHEDGWCAFCKSGYECPALAAIRKEKP